MDCSSLHYAFVFANNSMVTWGNNIHGQLCTGDFEDVDEPTVVAMEFEHTIAKIITHDTYTLVTTVDNQIYGCGDKNIMNTDEDMNQLTKIDLEFNNTIKHFNGGDNFAVIVTTTNEIYCWGNSMSSFCPSRKPALLTGEDCGKIAKISCSNHHCLLLNSEGRVFAFGDNNVRQLQPQSSSQVFKSIVEVTPQLHRFRKVIDINANAAASYFLSESHECFGISAESPAVCFSRGVCVQENICQCSVWYTTDCATINPYPIVLIVIAACVACLFFVVIPSASMILYYKQESTKAVQQSHELKEKLLSARDTEFEITNDEIGKGSFGIVRKGRCNNETVAVKTMQMDFNDRKHQAAENELWNCFEIPHCEFLVKMIAFRVEATGIHIVFEYCPEGSVYSKLEKAELTFSNQLQIAWDVSKAVVHLHKQRQSHLDVKPQNIFLK